MSEPSVAERIIPFIDLTLLGDDDTPDEIAELCKTAQTAFGPVAAVCVFPKFVAQATALLNGSGIAVASVANFPEGDDDQARAIAEARAIIAAGGTEVDVVFPWRSLAAGSTDVGRELVLATRQVVGPEFHLKVILESGELDDPELIRIAAIESLDGGADFLKTSTGKTERSATPAAARVLLETIASHDRPAGLKVSGGIRTVEQAGEYLALADEIMGPEWATPATFRFGVSSLLADVLLALQH